MWKIVIIALTTGLLATAAPATAFHGTAYVLTGTATFLDDVWGAELQWSGGFGAGGGNFRLVLVNPENGQSIPVTIQGAEYLPAAFINVPGCGSLEIVEPYIGSDRNTGGKVFRVDGIQDNCLGGGARGGQRHMHVEGGFLAWQLDLSLGTPFR